jgi:hypothetical protein
VRSGVRSVKPSLHLKKQLFPILVRESVNLDAVEKLNFGRQNSILETDSESWIKEKAPDIEQPGMLLLMHHIISLEQRWKMPLNFCTNHH